MTGEGERERESQMRNWKMFGEVENSTIKSPNI